VRYLLLSDLHSNREALDAVLADCHGTYDRIVSCGDLVGYGPDPNYVVEWSRQNLHTVIRGNHDRACCGLENPEWFNPVALAATKWTIARLSMENMEWLRGLPRGPAEVGDFLLVHGSPLDEDEYLATLDDAHNVFPYLESPITFFGHTHLQGGWMWTDESPQVIARPGPQVSSLTIELDPQSLWLINPGSVGQPRDSDPRAAYAIFDTEVREVQLRRVGYDTDAVRQKIELSGLPAVLGTRLAHGR
jgi:predicted phosphodiesterase